LFFNPKKHKKSEKTLCNEIGDFYLKLKTMGEKKKALKKQGNFLKMENDSKIHFRNSSKTSINAL
jgi:hypothetical protein